MYEARFSFGQLKIRSTCLQGGPVAIGMMSEELERVFRLVDRSGVQSVAIRLLHEQGKMRAILIVSDWPDETRSAAGELLPWSQLRGGSVSWRISGSAGEYDEMTAEFPPHQLALDHDGFLLAGRHVAVRFCLRDCLPSLVNGLGEASGQFCYQINLGRWNPDLEVVKEARKQVLHLRSEGGLPPAVLELQQSLADRLSGPGYLADEFLAVEEPASLEVLRREATLQFEKSMGTLGFGGSPLDPGNYDDFLASGINSSIFADPPPPPLLRGAEWVSANDLSATWKRLTEIRLAGNRRSIPEGFIPEVFISYSSRDTDTAMRVCAFLENVGLVCWIAPRNVAAGDSYAASINAGLEACRAMVVILSESSNGSIHVHREIDIALKRNLVIVPLRIDTFKSTGAMAYFMSTCQRIEAQPEQFEEALAAAAARLDPENA